MKTYKKMLTKLLEYEGYGGIVKTEYDQWCVVWDGEDKVIKWFHRNAQFTGFIDAVNKTQYLKHYKGTFDATLRYVYDELISYESQL